MPRMSETDIIIELIIESELSNDANEILLDAGPDREESRLETWAKETFAQDIGDNYGQSFEWDVDWDAVIQAIKPS